MIIRKPQRLYFTNRTHSSKKVAMKKLFMQQIVFGDFSGKIAILMDKTCGFSLQICSFDKIRSQR